MERITVRIPTDIYERIKNVKQENAHLSLNAIMVELIAQSLKRLEQGIPVQVIARSGHE